MDTTDKPREIVIHQSANRPNLLLGGDRELVLVMVMIAGGSRSAWQHGGESVWRLLLWVGSVAALQRMGKADPLLRHIYLRHIRYVDVLSGKERAPRTDQPKHHANWR